MILVDTSVWVDHLRRNDGRLAGLLEEGSVLMHPLVLGELACGNLKNRAVLLDLLSNLPHAPVASDPEVLTFIDKHTLMGRGIGYIDVHLLAATALAGTAKLWTRDRRLSVVADEMGLSIHAA